MKTQLLIATTFACAAATAFAQTTSAPGQSTGTPSRTMTITGCVGGGGATAQAFTLTNAMVLPDTPRAGATAPATGSVTTGAAPTGTAATAGPGVGIPPATTPPGALPPTSAATQPPSAAGTATATGAGAAPASGAGTTGAAGTAGTTGAVGTPGAATSGAGTPGAAGTPGTATAGSPSSPGVTGSTGTPGTRGAAGVAGTPGAVGTTGAVGTVTGPVSGYRLTGNDMTPWVGQRVQIVGTLVPPTAPAGASASASGANGTTQMPEFRVAAVQPVSGPCPRQ